MWKASVKDIDGEILCVSQFTLMANTTKGNKPDFHRAMVCSPVFLLFASNSSRKYAGYGTFSESILHIPGVPQGRVQTWKDKRYVAVV
jgi:D-Tyr-tRNAtyr deacylase